jgi:hypothetical protein
MVYAYSILYSIVFVRAWNFFQITKKMFDFISKLFIIHLIIGGLWCLQTGFNHEDPFVRVDIRSLE